MGLITDAILSQMRAIGQPKTITSTTTSDQTAQAGGTGGLGSLLGMLPLLYYMIKGEGSGAANATPISSPNPFGNLVDTGTTGFGPTAVPASRDLSSILANLPAIQATPASQVTAGNVLSSLAAPTGGGFDEMIAKLAPAAPKASLADFLGLIASLGKGGGIPTDIFARILGGRPV